MSGDSKHPEMKSAYEIALERLAEQGVAPPSRESLSDVVREKMEEARAKAEASLAELEILHRDAITKVTDPALLAEAETGYLDERQRIEARRDRELDRLRTDSQPE